MTAESPSPDAAPAAAEILRVTASEPWESKSFFFVSLRYSLAWSFGERPRRCLQMEQTDTTSLHRKLAGSWPPDRGRRHTECGKASLCVCVHTGSPRVPSPVSLGQVGFSTPEKKVAVLVESRVDSTGRTARGADFPAGNLRLFSRSLKDPLSLLHSFSVPQSPTSSRCIPALKGALAARHLTRILTDAATLELNQEPGSLMRICYRDQDSEARWAV